MGKLRIAAVTVLVLGLSVVFVGGVASALFLLRHDVRSGPVRESADDYEPVHKGAIDLSSGLYYRENDDLVVRGTPLLVLRRTYLSRYRVSRQFGIGTTHPGEESVVGDDKRFQWLAIILAKGTYINFRRISPGTSYRNSLFVHDETATDWQGAQLGWTGSNWALRKRDGSTAIYRGCGTAHRTECSILQARDAAGRTTYYRRHADGRLLKMDDGGDRWIAFEYDERQRVSRAHDSTGRSARYEYDSGGRLARVSTSDGIEHRYTYTESDELATISEPGTSIENVYHNGRCVRQVNRYPDSAPYVFDFSYHVQDGAVIATHTTRSDGTWSRYTWNERRHAATEANGRKGFEPTTIAYQRDPVTDAVTSFTLTCPDRTGRPLQHSGIVRDGNEKWVKWDLERTHCYRRSSPRQ